MPAWQVGPWLSGAPKGPAIQEGDKLGGPGSTPRLCAVLLAGVFKEVGTEPRGRGRPRQGPTWSFLAKNAENGNSRVKESPS